MSFDWSEYLTIAQVLEREKMEQCSDAVRYRTSIGRAYYAAFNVALAYLVEHGVLSGNESNKHEKVRDWFLHDQDGTRQSVGRHLRTMFSDRVFVDYPTTKPSKDLCLTARSTMRLAREVLTSLESMPAPRSRR